jgi:tetratricopeptide (TPR) repeat protein
MIKKYNTLIIAIFVASTIFYISMLILHNKTSNELKKITLISKLVNDGQFDKALVECKKLKSINPNDYEAYYFSGGIYYSLQKYDQAIEEYNKTLELKSNFIQCYIDRALTYDNMKQYNKSLSDYEHAFMLAPQCYIYLYYIAVANENLGKITDALEYYKKFLNIALSGSDKQDEFINREIEIAKDKISRLKV